ncbi:MAG: hypothetical protein JST54_00665 [Deltaproteobacteria bacterium]|nr:hypothetical protein [Deltaproteobacteria bacterium]
MCSHALALGRQGHELGPIVGGDEQPIAGDVERDHVSVELGGARDARLVAQRIGDAPDHVVVAAAEEHRTSGQEGARLLIAREGHESALASHRLGADHGNRRGDGEDVHAVAVVRRGHEVRATGHGAYVVDG